MNPMKILYNRNLEEVKKLMHLKMFFSLYLIYRVKFIVFSRIKFPKDEITWKTGKDFFV